MPHVTEVEKESYRQLIMSRTSYTGEEREAILAYCETDVTPLPGFSLLLRTPTAIDQALLLGEFIKVIAECEFRGVPIDVELLDRFKEHWTELKQDTVDRANAVYPIYDGQTLKQDRTTEWLASLGLLDKLAPYAAGRPCLDDKRVLKEMAEAYPVLQPFRDAKAMLCQLRTIKLTIGKDRRNRYSLIPCKTVTGRTIASSTKAIFGIPRLIRSLIRPLPGRVLVYADYAQQEIAVAAALSGDRAMQRAYRSSDPYISFAVQAGLVPGRRHESEPPAATGAGEANGFEFAVSGFRLRDCQTNGRHP